MIINKEEFGKMPDGTQIYKYTIENINGVRVGILSLGATLHSLFVPDREGEMKDVLLGFDDVEGYLERSSYQGASVGPVANRIGGGAFVLDGKKYDLIKNENGETCLHSGGEFSFAPWKAIITDTDSIEFSYVSPDGMNGFPGEVRACITYKLGANNDLHIKYKAVSDQKTFMNLTNHAYFNLSGYDAGDILSHELKLYCSAITPVDSKSIPTGELMNVDGSAFDFRDSKRIGDEIDNSEEQLGFTGGYDHNFVIDNADGSLVKCAEVYEPVSGRRMHVYTTMPGVQFYAGNFLKGEAGKENKPMNKRSGFCLETQFYPDTPNKSAFPQCVFEAGEEFISETVYTFEVSE